MNVYDFDKTIYDGDSSVDFYKFNLKRNKKLSKLWVKQAKAALLYKMGKQSKTDMKTTFYKYFTLIDDLDQAIAEFWDAHRHKIKGWYLEQKRDDDLIISASPEFLLQPICKELGLELIASVVDPKTGENLIPNCYGSEKVVRMKEHYNMEDMEDFYSDSYSDDPLAQYAKKSFMVVGDELRPW